LGEVKPIVRHLQHAKEWLDRAIVHLEAKKEEDALTCIQYAIQDENIAIKKLTKTY